MTPDAPTPAGDYGAARLVGDLVFTAGMTPRADGGVIATGALGAGMTETDAAPLAEVAARRAVAAGRAAVREAGRSLTGAASMTVYLAATPEFTQHSRVADGATAALRVLLPGPPPARTTIGVTSLPSGSPVEVSLILTSRALR